MENCNFTIPSLHLAPRRDGFLKDVSSIYSVRKSFISFRQWTKEGHGLVGDFPGWCQEGHKTFCISHLSQSTGQLTNPCSLSKWPSSRSDQHALALGIHIKSLFFQRTHTGFYDCKHSMDSHNTKATRHRVSTSTRWHFAFALCCYSNATCAPIANPPIVHN